MYVGIQQTLILIKRLDIFQKRGSEKRKEKLMSFWEKKNKERKGKKNVSYMNWRFCCNFNDQWNYTWDEPCAKRITEEPIFQNL